MRKRLKHIVIATATLLSLGALVCSGGKACYHHVTYDHGFPPWFGIDFRIEPRSNVHEQEPIYHFEGVQVYWDMLPVALGANALLAGVVFRIGQGINAAIWRNRKQVTEPRQAG